jgi:hypothetical protein
VAERGSLTSFFFFQHKNDEIEVRGEGKWEHTREKAAHFDPDQNNDTIGTIKLEGNNGKKGRAKVE